MLLHITRGIKVLRLRASDSPEAMMTRYNLARCITLMEVRISPSMMVGSFYLLCCHGVDMLPRIQGHFSS
jgi:hypothetical protein